MHAVARPHNDGRLQLQTVYKCNRFFFRLRQCGFFVCRPQHIHIRHHANNGVNLSDTTSDTRWQPFLTQCNAIIGVGTGTQHFNALRCFVQFRDRDMLISGIRQRRDGNASFCAFTIQHLQKIPRCNIHRLLSPPVFLTCNQSFSLHIRTSILPCCLSDQRTSEVHFPSAAQN